MVTIFYIHIEIYNDISYIFKYHIKLIFNKIKINKLIEGVGKTTWISSLLSIN